MSRGRRRNRPAIPERTCIASGEKLAQSDMIRFVLNGEGRVTPDVDGKLPGRGIWVKADKGAVERACSRKLFSRAAGRPAVIPGDLLAAAEASLVRRVSGLLSLARKSGMAVAGFERVLEELNRENTGLLLQASDGSPRQIGKLARRFDDVEICRCLKAGELGMAFGRQNVIHAAVMTGGLVERIRTDVRRLAGIRPD